MELRLNVDGSIGIVLRAQAQSAGIASSHEIEIYKIDRVRVQQLYGELCKFNSEDPARRMLVSPDFPFGPTDG